MSFDFKSILDTATRHNASDIHLVTGESPIIRVDTNLCRVDLPVLDAEAMEYIIETMLGETHKETLQKTQDVDLSWATDTCRYRVNVHYQRGLPAIAMRTVKSNIPPLETLNLPSAIESLVDLPRGLVLVTGDTGSGKSTTLASLLDRINKTKPSHIITLEDPVEYTFDSNQCLVEQRELGRDMPSFASGLKHALRQDPDIILVGEMRDLETTSLAISAAETGHLVLSTLHTVNAAQTVERIVDMYPANQQCQVRSMLANTLKAVISQTLLPKIGGGMVPAVEVLLCNAAVRNIIRESRTFEIPNVIETSGRAGMIARDASMASLLYNGLVEKSDVLANATDPQRMEISLAA
ncbi:MAG: PilT/PilU family type 4a pilus ATPase [Phycisphaerae bacterium]|jgi:twitching motility protein PilT|nr:PilT/PilU family type 4a pilus ATPase [Phycisphaerae bacterium]HJN71265.1 PilT/PilU family type 4a pilus ATPase [Phycisphaerales bacterium]|tara:strand:+ start:8886 stop:9941 length:1056 start_codon:yes stop_codon:yes gene_type:complete